MRSPRQRGASTWTGGRRTGRVRLIHGALTYRDKRLAGFDAAAIVEVIEHLDPFRLAAFERVVFESARPGLVVVTTPNQEYNQLFETLASGSFRHPDHRFEWTRTEFADGLRASPIALAMTSRWPGSGRSTLTMANRARWRSSAACRSRRRTHRPPNHSPRNAPNRKPDEMHAPDSHCLTIPSPSLVALIGVSGSGKSSFARRHFLPTEVVSSDYCRGLVSDDENSLEATTDAFDVLNYIAGKRLKRGLLTVIDATSVQREARASLVRLAREHHAIPVAIVLNMPERMCRERNASRPDRDFGPHVIRRQAESLRRSLRHLQKEGFRYVYILNSPEEVEAVEIVRQPLWVDRRTDHGPFDIIGDLHGCLR